MSKFWPKYLSFACLAVMECPCRAQKKDACQPHDVCLVMGEPFTSFIVDHQPEKARRITVEEALQIIAAEEDCPANPNSLDNNSYMWLYLFIPLKGK
jgi:hypothetical protein